MRASNYQSARALQARFLGLQSKPPSLPFGWVDQGLPVLPNHANNQTPRAIIHRQQQHFSFQLLYLYKYARRERCHAASSLSSLATRWRWTVLPACLPMRLNRPAKRVRCDCSPSSAHAITPQPAIWVEAG